MEGVKLKRCHRPDPSAPNTTTTTPHRPHANARSAAIAALTRLVESREEREHTGLFYTEGMRFVAQALASRFYRIESGVVCPELMGHPFTHQLRSDLKERDIPLLEVSGAVYRRLTQVEEPQGIALVVRQRWERMSRVRPYAGLCWIALDTVRSPGNLGTILRTLDAVGGAGLILIGDEIDPYAPQVVRATMGALFTQRFVRTTPAEFDHWRERSRVVLVGTSPHADADYQETVYPERTVLWMGGERKGLSAEQMAACDRVVRIPMVGQSDSLNLATATSVMLYELFNQRRRSAPDSG